MSSKKTADTGRYSDICGATNNRGEPCKLPSGWGTPGSGGNRCKFHGGGSTGPTNTEHLEGNDFAEGNPGGSAPALNSNAEKHGGFSDWRKAYDRLDEDRRAFVDRMIADMRETAKEHAPEVDPDRREELLKEKATLSVLWRKASFDAFAHTGEDARGFIIEDTVEIDGETYTIKKPNPALTATHRHSMRQRQIAKELRLWPGFQE